MSISFLKGKRLRYRNLLEEELEKGRNLIKEATQEQYDFNIFSKSLGNCIIKLNDFIEQLEQIDEKLSVMVDGKDGAQEVEQLITEDWSYIAVVVDSRYELVDIQQTLQHQMIPQDFSLMSVTKENYNQMIQLTAQMHQVLVDHKQLQQHQLKSVKHIKSDRTALFLRTA